MQKELTHIESGNDDYTLCGFVSDEFEEFYNGKVINETVFNFIEENYQEKYEYGSNCKTCITSLRKYKKIKY